MKLRSHNGSQTNIRSNQDQDGVLNEKLNQLKNTLSTYRGHLTRTYREIKELMSDGTRIDEANTKRDALDDIYASYNEASLKYYDLLTREEDKQFVQSLREEEKRRYLEFVQLYVRWLRNLNLLSIEHNNGFEAHDRTNNITEETKLITKTKASAPLEPHDEVPLYAGTLPQIPKKPSDLLSEARRSDSNRSKLSKQSQKGAIAQCKLRQLEAKQQVLDEQYKLESEMREKDFKTKIARLEMRKEIIDAQAEVEKCAIETEYSDVDGNDIEERSQRSLNLETQMFHERMEKFFSSESFDVQPGVSDQQQQQSNVNQFTRQNLKTQGDVPTIGGNNCEFDTRGQTTQSDRRNEFYTPGTHCYSGGSQLYQLL